jgi:hypothetical protein
VRNLWRCLTPFKKILNQLIPEQCSLQMINAKFEKSNREHNSSLPGPFLCGFNQLFSSGQHFQSDKLFSVCQHLSNVLIYQSQLRFSAIVRHTAGQSVFRAAQLLFVNRDQRDNPRSSNKKSKTSFMPFCSHKKWNKLMHILHGNLVLFS